MSIESLVRVAPPPGAVEPGVAQRWAHCQQQLGLSLPSDYRQLIDTYGTGCWMDFLWVLSPFAKNTNLNLLTQAPLHLDGERTIRAQWPEEVPFPLYPEPEGLFPWAITDNGNRLYWQTCGEPEDWPTIIYESRGPRFDQHSLSCTEFLTRWVSGYLAVNVFPTDFNFGSPDPFASVSE